jgi:hypothetical protein
MDEKSIEKSVRKLIFFVKKNFFGLRSLALPDPAVQAACILLSCSGTSSTIVLGPRFFKHQDHEKRARAKENTNINRKMWLYMRSIY